MPSDRARGAWVVDPRRPTAAELVRGVARGSPSFIDPSGSTLARVDMQRTPFRLLTSAVSPAEGTRTGRGAPTSVVPFRGSSGVQGWIDRTHLAVETPSPGHPDSFRLASVDVRTGVARTLVEPWSQTLVAADLLSAPSVHVSPPPSPWDRRWVTSLLALGGVTLVLLFWRRRARRA